MIQARDKGRLAIQLSSWSWVLWFVVPYVFLFSVFVIRFDAVSVVINDSRFWSAFIISIFSALAVVILTAIFALPVAHYLTYSRFRFVSLFESLLIDIPQTFPPVAVGVIYLFMLGPGSPINIAFTFTAVVIAKLLVSAPFTVGYTLRKFREIRESKLDLVARSLGANTNDVFFRILIPLARKDITAGLTLSWARAMGEFGGSLIFAGVIAYKTEVLPTYTSRVVASDPYRALAATAVITLFAIITIVLVRAIFKQREK